MLTSWSKKLEHKQVEQTVRTWVETLVVGLNFCPFARRELLADKVRFSVTKAATEEQLLVALQDELELLSLDDSIETTLLIHPRVLQDFYDYNQFLNFADGLLAEMALQGVYQVASFHPNYQFGGTRPDDAENFTNRSPYPMLHLIREASVERAVANHPDSTEIPNRNIALTKSIGKKQLQSLLDSCFQKDAG